MTFVHDGAVLRLLNVGDEFRVLKVTELRAAQQSWGNLVDVSKNNVYISKKKRTLLKPLNAIWSRAVHGYHLHAEK